MSEEKIEVCFQYNKDTRERLEKMEERHDAAIAEFRKDLKEIVDRVINRLPPWVLFYISFLTLLVGGLLAKVAF